MSTAATVARGGRFDPNAPFTPVRIAVLTISDTRDEESDTSGQVDAIITTGGTGITGRDVTPEAVEPLLDKKIDGFSVIFHLVSYQSVGLSTLQSRALAGIIDGVFIFCLPGSNGAVKDGWDQILAEQLDSRNRPCNFVELMPRFRE